MGFQPLVLSLGRLPGASPQASIGGAPLALFVPHETFVFCCLCGFGFEAGHKVEEATDIRVGALVVFRA